MHGWIGQGWQSKYAWLPDDNSFHFTGTVKGTVKIPKGELINKKYFKLPPFTASISVKVAFGEFCTTSGCTSYKWGMSASIEVFGYDVGLYVDSGGPDLILGTNSHKLIDQFGGGSAPQAPMLAEGGTSNQIVFPGNYQQYLIPPITSTLDTVSPDLAQNICGGYSTSIHTCPFLMPVGTGKAMFSASWENGSLDIVLIKPDNTIITPANAAAHGVTITPSDGELTKGITFSVRSASGSTLATGDWKLRLSNVGNDMLPGATNNYSLLFAADPPAPTVLWNTLPVPNGSGIVNLSWTASRGGQPLEASIKAELFYSPVSEHP